MNGRFEDDDLRAMLEARADRVPPDAPRTVMAAVRSEVGSRRGGATFAVSPVALGRATRSPAGWAAAAVVVALLVAVVSGLPGGHAGPTAGPSGSAGPSEPLASLESAEASLVANLEVQRFMAQLASGALDGRIVVIPGQLEVVPLPCPDPAPDGCIQGRIRGLPGVVVTMSGHFLSTTTGSDTTGTNRELAFRAEHGTLAFLGGLLQDPSSPISVRQLVASPPSSGDLSVVSGWMGTRGGAPTCPRVLPSTGACPGERTLGIASTNPPLYAAPIDWTAVSLAPFVTAPTGEESIAGRWLVRAAATLGGGGIGFVVVASIDASLVRVSPENTGQQAAASASPRPTASATPLPAGVLTAAELRAAVADGSLRGRVVVVDGTLERLAIPCVAPGGPQCVSLVVRGLEGVPIEDPADLRLSGTVEFPAVGPLVFAGEAGELTFLGRWVHGVQWPLAVIELLEDDRIAPDALWAVYGWLVVGGIHSCPAMDPACPGPGPWLTDTKPFDDGMLASGDGATVALNGGPVGLQPGQIVTGGPFLLRLADPSGCRHVVDASGATCAGRPSGWEVVAVLDPQIVVRAVVP